MPINRFIRKIREYLYTQKHSRPFVPVDELEPIISSNRAVLNSVATWIDDKAMAESCFGYGIPERVRPLMDRKINNDPTYSDVMCVLLARLSAPINYLEIGVSVGKNFLQIASASSGARLTGFDIEDISPVLSSRFAFDREETRWMPPKGSMRHRECSVKHFTYHANQIRYVCGDVFDDKAWNQLSGEAFNFVYSDAFHSPEALLHEWDMIEKRGLLAKDSFICMWDDLGGAMTDAFAQVASRIEKHVHPRVPEISLCQYNGWNGEHESPHTFGLVTLGVAPSGK